MKRLILAAVAISFVITPTAAQVGAGEVGLSMSKPSGAAGTLCSRTFTCAFEDTPLQRGEIVDLVVRGVYGQPFAVLIGGVQPTPCVQIPGIHNMLMFGPAFVPFAGVLDEPDFILACPGGLKSIRFRVPQRLPTRSQVLFQALAWSYLFPQGEVPTFTPAIRGNVF